MADLKSKPGGDSVETCVFGEEKDEVGANVGTQKREETEEAKSPAFPWDGLHMVQGLKVKGLLYSTERPPKFEGHKKMGSFGIDANLNYGAESRPRAFHCSVRDLSQNMLGENLNEGQDKATLISDYLPYRKLKWDYFLRNIHENEYMRDREVDAVPHFVAFAGAISSMMMTSYDFEDWTIYATKYKGTIYLSKLRPQEIPLAAAEPHVPQVTSTGAGDRKFFVDQNMYFALNFQNLLSKKEGHQMQPINEYEKHFSVFETAFGGNRLLLLGEVDVVDHQDEEVKVKLRKNFVSKRDEITYHKKKLLNGWTQCVISGMQYLVFGERDATGILKAVEVLEMDEICQYSSRYWTPGTCYSLLERALNYIRQHCAVDDPLLAYKFDFHRNCNFVNFHELPPGSAQILPKWFLE